MRGATQSLVIVALVLALPACQFRSVTHSPMKAAYNANQFLIALYFDEDYAKALELADEQLRQSATPNDLKTMTDKIKQEYGALKKLKADSYLMEQGNTMELFYVGEYEKGTLYHSLVLVGDTSSGYRVSGVWHRPEPYPDDPLRRKFDVEIFVH